MSSPDSDAGQDRDSRPNANNSNSASNSSSPRSQEYTPSYDDFGAQCPRCAECGSAATRTVTVPNPRRSMLVAVGACPLHVEQALKILEVIWRSAIDRSAST